MYQVAPWVTAVVVTALFPQVCLAQTRSEKIAALRDHAVPIRSIQPTDTDFRDLRPLRGALSGVRLVLLGEQSHGDGATFLAKARLIRFLHEELGFDVLAFESGFYDCNKAAALFEAGEAADIAIRRCVFPIWTASTEFQPTIDYMEETRFSSKPLQLTGFDSQLTGSASREFLLDELEELAYSVEPGFDWASWVRVLFDLIHLNSFSNVSAIPTPDAQAEFGQALAEFAEAVSASTASRRAFWAQAIRSLSAHARTVWSSGDQQPSIQSSEIRDRQMAENLLWLLSDSHKDDKVIVWAATFHNARNLERIDVHNEQAAPVYSQMRTMGSYLEEALGSELYSVGFIAQEGERGSVFMGAQPLPPGDSDTLESMLDDAGFETAFVDLRGLTESTAWLRTPIPSRPLGYVRMTAVWGDIVDGFVFTRLMTASTPANQ